VEVRARLREPVPLLLGGYNYLPVRAFPKERILQLAESARQHSDRGGLVSIALCDHPDIERSSRGSSTWATRSVPRRSARRSHAHHRPPAAESGERTITIAPEVGSDRLARVINKTVTNAEILAAAELIFARASRT
jgi:hypothetical protein